MVEKKKLLRTKKKKKQQRNKTCHCFCFHCEKKNCKKIIFTFVIK